MSEDPAPYKFTPATYPDAPGFKAPGTSEDAAKSTPAIGLQCAILRFFSAYAGGNGLTADECAHGLAESILSIRPRFSELKRHGILIDTKIRRKNDSGKSAIVWAIAPKTYTVAKGAL